VVADLAGGPDPRLAASRDRRGVAVVRLTSLASTPLTHLRLLQVLESVAADPATRVVVLRHAGGPAGDGSGGAGADALERFARLQVPVIGVADGPVTAFAEYLLLADVVVASQRATLGHRLAPGTEPDAGRAAQAAWEEAVGPTRARWLLWTGETLDARTAYEWGAVSEILADHRLEDRLRELSGELAARPDPVRRAQRAASMGPLVQRMALRAPPAAGDTSG
jgi:enoyl-CoA hydratase/carnithine racemase